MRVSLACLLALACLCVLARASPLAGSSELSRLHAVMSQWDESAIMPLINRAEDIDRLEAAVQSHQEDVALIEQAAQSDSDQEIDVVVDTSAADKAEATAEENAIMQNEVDAELDTDSESESSQEADAEASEPEIAAAKSVLSAVVDEAAEDYPSMAEVASDAEADVDADAETDADADADADSETDDSDPDPLPCALGSSDKDASGPVVMAEVSSDADQEIDVVVDSSAADKAEADAEQNAIIQNEVDAELDTDSDSESESSHEAEAEASDPEIAAAKSVLNAVVDEKAEDYPSLAEVSTSAEAAHEPIVHALVWSGQGGDINAKRAGEIDPVMIKSSAKKLESSQDRSLITMSFEAMNAGCGSGVTRSVTPQLHFKPACMQHDVCYNRCNVSQLQCDNEFQSDMLAICKRKFPGTSVKAKTGYRICIAGAAVYHRAVRTWGSTPFRDSQAKFCPQRRK